MLCVLIFIHKWLRTTDFWENFHGSFNCSQSFCQKQTVPQTTLIRSSEAEAITLWELKINIWLYLYISPGFNVSFVLTAYPMVPKARVRTMHWPAPSRTMMQFCKCMITSPHVSTNSKPCIWIRLPSWWGVGDYLNSIFHNGWECNATSSLRSPRDLGLDYSHHVAPT